MKQPKVGVVILNFKLREQVIECIKSVLKSDYPNLKIIVVDNDSGDDIAQHLEKFPEIEFIPSRVNTGYTGGNNLGIKAALGQGCDWVFVLNPDTTITKTTISELVKTAIEQKAGMVGPKIYFKDSQVIWFAGGKFDRQNVIGSHQGVDQLDEGQFDEISPAEYLTGAAMLVQAEVFEEIGVFDERYFLYYEDSDLSFRAKLAGYKLLYVPKAVVYHANAQATGLGTPRQDYYITRNRMLFAGKYLPFRTQFAVWRQALFTSMIGSRRKALFDASFERWGNGHI